jgi:hypothetical protein
MSKYTLALIALATVYTHKDEPPVQAGEEFEFEVKSEKDEKAIKDLIAAGMVKLRDQDKPAARRKAGKRGGAEKEDELDQPT